MTTLKSMNLIAASVLLAACSASPVAVKPLSAVATPSTPAQDESTLKSAASDLPVREVQALENRTWFLINLPIAISAGGAHSREGYIRFNHVTGKLEGHTGCNPFTADYVVDEKSLKITNLTGGKAPCTDAVTFEALLIQSLSDAVGWEQLDDGRLLLKGSEDFPLAVFRPADR